jgi:hypothetical protein
MAWIDDALPLPAARPVEGDEALDAAIHAFAALAAGIAAMQAFVALVAGDSLRAAIFTAALVATGACAFVGDGSRLRRVAFLVGGPAMVLVWLAVLPQASGPAMGGALAMAGVSAALTRRLLLGAGDPGGASRAVDSRRDAPLGWIEGDSEGTLGSG